MIMTVINFFLILIGTYKFQAMKEAMTMFTPCNVGPPRDNIIRLSPEQINDMEANVKKLL